MAPKPTHRRPVVELYERLAEAIRVGTYPPGSTLPSEPELAAAFGVSRPALREALILLQEDGVITVRRGVGRTVNEHAPRRGFERLRPIEELLGSGQVTLRAQQRAVEDPTDVVLQHLWMAPTGQVRFWESIIEVDGVAACLAHEWCVDETLGTLDRGLPFVIEQAVQEPRTMLHAVLGAAHTPPLRAASTVVASVLGRQRGLLLGRDPQTPIVLITQVVSAENTPVLLAKYMVPSGAPALPVVQSR